MEEKIEVGGKVRVKSEKIEKEDYKVKVGDVMNIKIERRIIVYKVMEKGERRGKEKEEKIL